MDHSVIVTTPAQLKTIIDEAVCAIIPKLADFRRKNEAVETDGMTVENAARFLTEQGIPTTRSSLYNLIYKNSIPYRKFGRRTVFSKKELLVWIDERLTRPVSKRSEAALRIARSVENKGCSVHSCGTFKIG
ncbi:helix-turn-helix domain-containing protein [Alistipes muris]|uniref:helix-turn-helix domain-containing protein n=1 Tax=Alistipes muris TaxID=2941326 RepID=UPI0020402F06|nr:helix-turn-helix domain-containing protein [Alistipes muris]MCX4282226.1 helix-turn-helix domain-containing protein [Alistipes sp.]